MNQRHRLKMSLSPKTVNTLSLILGGETEFQYVEIKRMVQFLTLIPNVTSTVANISHGISGSIKFSNAPRPFLSPLSTSEFRGGVVVVDVGALAVLAELHRAKETPVDHSLRPAGRLRRRTQSVARHKLQTRILSVPVTWTANWCC
jgi:hypothetical protein